jgi:hypothetical protein
MFPPSNKFSFDRNRLRFQLAHSVGVNEVSALAIHGAEESRQYPQHQGLHVVHIFFIMKAVPTKPVPQLAPHLILMAFDATSNVAFSHVDGHGPVKQNINARPVWLFASRNRSDVLRISRPHRSMQTDYRSTTLSHRFTCQGP